MSACPIGRIVCGVAIITGHSMPERLKGLPKIGSHVRPRCQRRLAGKPGAELVSSLEKILTQQDRLLKTASSPLEENAEPFDVKEKPGCPRNYGGVTAGLQQRAIDQVDAKTRFPQTGMGSVLD